MDLYGGLLTEKQRTFIHLHFEDDLSFGEIARQHGVSRQAIHDATKHADLALEKYEEQLGLLSRGFSRSRPDTAESAGDSAGDAARPTADATKLRAIAGRLRDMEGRVRKSGGVIYNGDGLARELGEIAGDLEAAAETGAADV